MTDAAKKNPHRVRYRQHAEVNQDLSELHQPALKVRSSGPSATSQQSVWQLRPNARAIECDRPGERLADPDALAAAHNSDALRLAGFRVESDRLETFPQLFPDHFDRGRIDTVDHRAGVLGVKRFEPNVSEARWRKMR
jgi:hypothetical protein